MVRVGSKRDLKRRMFDVRFPPPSKAALTVPKSDFRYTPESGLKSDIAPCPKSAKGLNRSRGRTLWLATQRSNRRHVILTRGAISLLRAMIRWTC